VLLILPVNRQIQRLLVWQMIWVKSCDASFITLCTKHEIAGHDCLAGIFFGHFLEAVTTISLRGKLQNKRFPQSRDSIIPGEAYYRAEAFPKLPERSN
jgi:hypothetical protein